MLKVLMAASEAAPFAKTGGLADVLGSLPAALIDKGADVRVIMPKYGTIPPVLKQKIIHKYYIYIRLSWKNQYCGIEEAEHNGVTYYFIDNEFYFKRDGLYGYGDEAERFAFFCHAVLEALPKLDFYPDIIHCHDWQTGMIPVLLEAKYNHLDSYKNIATVFTIHNLKYQGVFDIPLIKELFDLGEGYFTYDKLEFYNGAGFLKGGLVYSDIITTVSKTYAGEILSPSYGERLEGLLKSRYKDLHGIINGISYEEYNPENDPYIYKNYEASSLENKKVNKTELQEELNMPINADVAVIGLISRLVDQKGLDLIESVLDEILDNEIQLYILGTGDEKYERLFETSAEKHPEKVSANIRFDNRLAHRIYAGCDLFLMPSLFEPCGLGQMISIRYGTLPIVRETGGLKDSVVPFDELTGKGTGFSFTEYNAHEMLQTINHALTVYKSKETWAALQKDAMSQDFSWQSSAGKYMELYLSLTSKKQKPI